MSVSEFHIFALASHGTGISGGDRIWIELTRRWSNLFPTVIHTWDEGKQMGDRQHLSGEKLRYILSPIPSFTKSSFVLSYLARIVEGIRLGFAIKILNDKSTYIYNASEFWMDAIPSIIIKIRFPKITWVSTWYQTAPNPLRGFTEKKRSGGSYKFTALLYWLTQLPIKPFIIKYADVVIVNNEDERKQFPGKKTVVLIGAVPLEDIRRYQSKAKTKKVIYDAVFQGRFHPQKGVEELVTIWKEVVEKIPSAKLAMIGDGSLMQSVKAKIKIAKLEPNVDLLGYVFDGKKKYDIFAGSKIVVHPAFYDSGGMATAEAMAFGIPAVGFNLKAYDSYYPKGMMKVKTEEEFSKEIVKLLTNERLREKLGKEAKELIERKYSWDERAKEVLDAIQ